MIDRRLIERISLQGIARVTQVSWSWLQAYVNQKLAQTPRQVKVLVKPQDKLIIECDEMWSFVDRQKNEVYIWLAIDRNSRKIVGCFVGDRTRKSARKLWASLPDIYQQSDERLYRFLASVTLQLFPIKVTLAVGKKTNLTNQIKQLNNTFRQRVSRAGERKPIIFQKAEQFPLELFGTSFMATIQD